MQVSIGVAYLFFWQSQSNSEHQSGTLMPVAPKTYIYLRPHNTALTVYIDLIGEQGLGRSMVRYAIYNFLKAEPQLIDTASEHCNWIVGG